MFGLGLTCTAIISSNVFCIKNGSYILPARVFEYLSIVKFSTTKSPMLLSMAAVIIVFRTVPIAQFCKTSLLYLYFVLHFVDKKDICNIHF